MNDIQTTDNKAVAEAIDGRKIREYLDAFGLANDMNDREVKQFTEIAQAFQLNPFKREIYCIAYGQGEKRRLSIITGYEVYLKRADRLGSLGGWRAWTEGTCEVKTVEKELPGRNGGTYKKTIRVPRGDMKALVEIHRKDWTEPFRHEVYLEEYAQANEMWADKPRTMLKKVAIAQAFRMAFPDEMGGMPYSREELPDAPSEPINVSPAKDVAPTQAEESKPAADEPRTVNAEVVDNKPSSAEAKIFRGLLDDIADALSQKDNSGEYWFSESERNIYREKAKLIGSQDKNSKLDSMGKLKASIVGVLFTRQDEAEKVMADLDSAAGQAFDQQEELPIF